MVSTPREQFLYLVERTSASANAYTCDGDTDTAFAWDSRNEITVRLALRGDEIWLFAGSGLLVRFVADSEGEFDLDGAMRTIASILAGEAVEYFGVRDRHPPASFATGFSVGADHFMQAGLGVVESVYSAHLAGPLARASL